MRKRRSTPYLRRMLASGHDYVLAPYGPHSWWHELGRPKMVRRLEARGFPSLFGWLFVTLTVDPELFSGPVEAFERGRDRIRRAVARLRERHHIRRYFVKFELTEAGWPHWHLGLDCREHIENEDLYQAWGFGWTKIKRVKKPRDFRYLFKYVTKDSAGEGVPDWVLDYPKTIRVFQTSSGFFREGEKNVPSDDVRERDVKPLTLREKWLVWLKRGVLRGRAVGFFGVPVHLSRTFTEIFIEQAEKGQRPLDMYHMPVSQKVILETVINNGCEYRTEKRNANGPYFYSEDGRIKKVLAGSVVGRDVSDCPLY